MTALFWILARSFNAKQHRVLFPVFFQTNINITNITATEHTLKLKILICPLGKFWTVRMTLRVIEVWRWDTKIMASRDDVWVFYRWADPLTVFCWMRQDCAHWNEQIWPLYDGVGLQLLYSWDEDVALEISFIFFATMFMSRAWRDLFSNQISSSKSKSFLGLWQNALQILSCIYPLDKHYPHLNYVPQS